jgi:BirA family transcriptional regulator, biotin operon repressor / biotin---[acetyl-CoA-carboxylase] ligase
MIPIEEWALDTAIIGRRVLVFDCVESTNSMALDRALDPANDGLVLLANRQTAGRGQHGRVWQSPAGASVLMSALVFPPDAVRRPAILTALAAVAVCTTIRKLTLLEPTIKWPNDVLVDGRKVCGILIEQARGTVIGIGLNVNQPAMHFDEAGLPDAASLAVLTGKDHQCHDVARTLIVELDTLYGHIGAGNLIRLETQWRQYLGLVGNVVIAETAHGQVQGRLTELAMDRVAIEQPRGMAVLRPEGIKHLWPAGQD